MHTQYQSNLFIYSQLIFVLNKQQLAGRNGFLPGGFIAGNASRLHNFSLLLEARNLQDDGMPPSSTNSSSVGIYGMILTKDSVTPLALVLHLSALLWIKDLTLGPQRMIIPMHYYLLPVKR